MMLRAVLFSVLACASIAACGNSGSAEASPDKSSVGAAVLPSAPSADVASPTPAPSDEVASDVFERCMEAAKSQLEKINCISAEKRRLDVQLNQAYQALLKKLDKEKSQRVIEAQRAWLASNDADGAVEAMFLDELGQLGAAQAEQYDLKRLEARLAQLKEYLSLASNQ